MSAVPSPAALLSVRRLKVYHPLPQPWPWSAPGYVKAVEDVHFNLHAGETLGIVGESGCGKSTLARALAGLQPVTSGGIRYGAHDLATLSREQWRPLRREIQMVFQDPIASLDPRMSLGDSIGEPLFALHPELEADERRRRVCAMLERVGLSAEHYHRYPHEFSGGQCQRVGIARALIVKPKILICDEPVSSLDVSVQAQIINLLAELQREQNLTLICIAHDLAVVRHLSHRVLVMYLGRIVEQAATEELFEQPRHPYTRALLASVPGNPLGLNASADGELPSPAEPPSGCVFRTRCPIADTHCAGDIPYLRRLGRTHYAACHYVQAQSADQALGLT